MGDRPVHGPLLIETRPARPGDAEAVLEVILARDLVDVGEPDFTLDDVRDEMGRPGGRPGADSLVVSPAPAWPRTPYARRTRRTSTSIPSTAASASGPRCCRWWRHVRSSGACPVASTSRIATPRRPPAVGKRLRRDSPLLADGLRPRSRSGGRPLPGGCGPAAVPAGVDDRKVHALVQAAFSEIEGTSRMSSTRGGCGRSRAPASTRVVVHRGGRRQDRGRVAVGGVGARRRRLGRAAGRGAGLARPRAGAGAAPDLDPRVPRAGPAAGRT